MYWILLVMGLVVAVVAAILVGGMVTPRAHEVRRSITLRAAPDVVWRTVRLVSDYPSWRRDVRQVAIERFSDSGLAGASLPREGWRETSSRGSVTFGIVRDDAPVLFAARIMDEDLPFSGEWTWTLLPMGSGTTLTISERGAVSNVVVRFLAAHVFGYSRSIEQYLTQLAHHVGEPTAAIVEGHVD